MIAIGAAWVGLPWGIAIAKGDDILPANEVFKLSARIDARGALSVRYAVAPGHYLYKQRLSATLNGTSIAQPNLKLPRGTKKVDPQWGRVDVFARDIEFTPKLKKPLQEGKHLLTIRSQGCSETHGICYPPADETVELSWQAGVASAWQVPTASVVAGFGGAAKLPPSEGLGRFAKP
jgi:thiol:disulfide interchange protein DsbD